MRPNDLIDHLRKQPFKPIRLFVSDGSAFDVRHPEMLMVGRTEVIVAIQQAIGMPAERFIYLDPVHITRVEPINGNGQTEQES